MYELLVYYEMSLVILVKTKIFEFDDVENWRKSLKNKN